MKKIFESFKESYLQKVNEITQPNLNKINDDIRELIKKHNITQKHADKVVNHDDYESGDENVLIDALGETLAKPFIDYADGDSGIIDMILEFFGSYKKFMK